MKRDILISLRPLSNRRTHKHAVEMVLQIIECLRATGMLVQVAVERGWYQIYTGAMLGEYNELIGKSKRVVGDLTDVRV